MTQSSKSQRVEIVDYLRLFAAAAVLAFHWLFNGIQNGKIDSLELSPLAVVAKYGYLGVDMFFLISGYVIAQSALGKTPRRFFVGRVVRLYPAFWIALLITTGFAIFLGGEHMSVTLPQFFANLTMIPNVLGQPFVDGVYWTLVYELSFYAAVFLVLLFRLGEHLDKIICGWALGMGAVAVVLPTLAGLPLLGNYYPLFASGAIVAAIRRDGWTWLRGVALGVGFATTIAFEVRDATGARAIVIAVLTVAMFGVLLATLNNRVSMIRLPGSKAAGSLTYPLYLLHAHIGYMLLSTFATEQNKWLVYAVVLVFIVGLAWTLHVVVERRRFWYPLFDRTLGSIVDAISFQKRERRGDRRKTSVVAE